ncbi:MAG TPA: hypothetical protein VEC16_04795, partial [Alphaproteobacteria bacterium]|nr:hypothetical protein [Alphaproteobacteria bacterium]
WAGLLIASGMVANAGISTIVELYETQPTQATMLWISIESVANGLGGANGEILGGLMTLLISIVCIKSNAFPRSVSYLGIFVGIAGIASTIPYLNDLVGIFAISQIIWFICIGILLLRKNN